MICWKASLTVCLMNQRSLQLLHAPWSSYSNHPDASSSSFWCNSLETAARGPHTDRHTDLTKSTSSTCSTLEPSGRNGGNPGQQVALLNSFFFHPVRWHKKVWPSRRARAPLFLIFTLSWVGSNMDRSLADISVSSGGGWGRNGICLYL